MLPEVHVLDIPESPLLHLRCAFGSPQQHFQARSHFVYELAALQGTPRAESDIREVLRAGARGYILRSETDEQIVRAVEALAQHHAFFSDHVSGALLKNFVKQAASSNNSLLTVREREVVQLIAEGNSNKKIARLLSRSIKTVETHRSASMRKLDVHTTVDLVRYAVRNGLVLP
jgi:DNA-binding NarL/FixJ family response regulator